MVGHSSILMINVISFIDGKPIVLGQIGEVGKTINTTAVLKVFGGSVGLGYFVST